MTQFYTSVDNRIDSQFDFDREINRRSPHSNSIKWNRYGSDVLPMWIADMDFAAPEPVVKALARAVEHGIYGYELPNSRLRRVVAARMERLYGWCVQPEWVVAVPGIVAGFNLAARALCAPGEGLITQPPVYPPFLHVAEQQNLTRQLAPLRRLPLADRVAYAVDWDALDQAHNSGGGRTAMLLLCSPHNPTGHVWSRDDLTLLGEWCLRRGVVLCSDEIHAELLLGGSQHIPAASLNSEIAQQSITLLSASKTFNVVGFGCGFAIIPNPQLRGLYLQAMDRAGTHVSSFGLIVSEAAYGIECEPWLRALQSYLTANRDYLVGYIRGTLPGLMTSLPEATFLAWLDCAEYIARGHLSEQPAMDVLREARVALNPGADFGPGGEGFVRLNFGCPRRQLKEGLDRIAGYLQRRVSGAGLDGKKKA